MDFVVSDDQRALAEAVRSACAKQFPLDELARRDWALDVVRADDWRALADMGVFDLRVPEGDGGLGLGLPEAAVVFEELGRALVPGPLVATEVARALGLVPVAGPDADRAPVGTGVVGSVRDRAPLLVEHLPALDVLVLVDDDRRHLTVVDRDTLGAAGAEPAGRSLDPLGPRWLVAGRLAGRRVTEVRAQGNGTGRHPDGYGRWRRDEQVLTAALCVGIAAAAGELAVAYAGQRQQFGRAIGSFQAVKHLCADMFVRTETARAAVHAAAVTAEQPGVGDAERAAAGAALVAGEAAAANAKACLQVHGGVGFTWDLPVHRYLTRARVLVAGLEPPAALARAVAAAW